MLYSFPFGILSVNVIGSFLIGFCWSIAEAYNFSINTRAFLFTGLFSRGLQKLVGAVVVVGL